MKKEDLTDCPLCAINVGCKNCLYYKIYGMECFDRHGIYYSLYRLDNPGNGMDFAKELIKDNPGVTNHKY